MESGSAKHDLLPWYATGKLETREAEEFRGHLASCPDCREELAFVESVKAGVEAHGQEFFHDHPATERLVGAVLGQLDEHEAAVVRRHLAMCAVCSVEARWVRGEAAAGAEPAAATPLPFEPRRASFVKWSGWAAAAAASIVLAFVVSQRPQVSAPPGGFAETRFLRPTERAGAEPIRFSQRERQRLLLVEVDLPGAAFPVAVEVVDRSDRVVFREAGIERSELADELYYTYPCPDGCVPGHYTLSVTGTDPGESALTYAFEIGADSP